MYRKVIMVCRAPGDASVPDPPVPAREVIRRLSHQGDASVPAQHPHPARPYAKEGFRTKLQLAEICFVIKIVVCVG